MDGIELVSRALEIQPNDIETLDNNLQWLFEWVYAIAEVTGTPAPGSIPLSFVVPKSK